MSPQICVIQQQVSCSHFTLSTSQLQVFFHSSTKAEGAALPGTSWSRGREKRSRGLVETGNDSQVANATFTHISLASGSHPPKPRSMMQRKTKLSEEGQQIIANNCMVYHSPNVARKAMLNLLKGRIETFFLCPSVWVFKNERMVPTFKGGK